MDPTAQNIFTAILALLGAGGVGAAIVGAFANRNKNQADTVKVTNEALANTARELTTISQDMVTSINGQLRDLSAKYNDLEKEVANLKLELLGRERMVNELKLENKSLKIQVEKLQAENLTKDAVIKELSAKVCTLENRLDRITKANYEQCEPLGRKP